MLKLFNADPGIVTKLFKPDLEEARSNAAALLGEESFRSLGMNRKYLEPKAKHLMSDLGQATFESTDTVYTVEIQREHAVILGFDIVKGLSVPPEGTWYSRPVAENIDESEQHIVADKSFMYIPLIGKIEIEMESGIKESMEPGQAFLATFGAAHTVHVPKDVVTLELVLDHETEKPESAWDNYIEVQPNPNL